MSVFLTRYGLLLLIFPVVWLIYASTAARLERGLYSTQIAHLTGVIFSGATIVAFLYALVFM